MEERTILKAHQDYTATTNVTTFSFYAFSTRHFQQSHYYWHAQWASIVSLAGVCRLSRRRLWSSVTLPAGGPATRHVGGRPPPGWRVGVGWPTLHGGPVWLHPVRATPCSLLWSMVSSIV